MAFDKLNKGIDRLLQKHKAADAAADLAQEEWAAFEAMLPKLKADVLYPSLSEAEAILNRGRLDAKLVTNGVITDWLGQKPVRVSGTSESLYDLSFRLPHPDDPQVPYFDGRVSMIVIVPTSAPLIEVHATDTDVSSTKGRYINQFALRLPEITKTRFAEEIEKTIGRYTGLV